MASCSVRMRADPSSASATAAAARSTLRVDFAAAPRPSSMFANTTSSGSDVLRTVVDMDALGERTVIVDYLTAKSLLSMKCRVCHKVDRPLSTNQNLSDWKATVTRMSGKKPGHLTPEEIDLIASYLAVERPAK